jgi:hypothetical protein
MAELARVILNAEGTSADELAAGLRAGAGAVMGVIRPEQLRSLATLRREFRFDVYPVVPDAPAYVRDLADLGLIGAALKRLRRLAPGGWVKLAVYGVRNVFGVLAADFATMLGVTVQMELPAFAPFRPPVVFLHHQMTDLLLACRNAAGYRAFAALARRAGAEPGLETRNFGHLLPLLRQAGADVTCVAATFNPLGYRMRPSASACEALLADRTVRVLAEDPTAQRSVDTEKARAYVQARGLEAVVVHDDVAAKWIGVQGI